MEKQFYFLSPVEVVKVTPANLQEVAEWCGGKVATTESRRVPGRMDPYVWVPTPKGTNISWAFPGMYITKRLVVGADGKLKATWAVYRRDYFEKNYFTDPTKALDATWGVAQSSKMAIQNDSTPVVINVHVQNVENAPQEVAEGVKEALAKMDRIDRTPAIVEALTEASKDS
jgi:hypothetical protein